MIFDLEKLVSEGNQRGVFAGRSRDEELAVLEFSVAAGNASEQCSSDASAEEEEEKELPATVLIGGGGSGRELVPGAETEV